MSPQFFEVKLLHPLATLLTRSGDGSAGYDLRACLDAPLSLRYGENAQMIPTGLAIHLKDQNVAAIILPKSGEAHRRGLVLGNTVGLVGLSTQQWYVSAWNRGPADEIVIRPGDLVAQVVFVPIIHPAFLAVAEFSCLPA